MTEEVTTHEKSVPKSDFLNFNYFFENVSKDEGWSGNKNDHRGSSVTSSGYKFTSEI